MRKELDYIRVINARTHNLKNLSVDIPKNSLVVITGLSGSGKSSLAFDTIYAEGQRRYVESLSSYARQFLGLMEKPDVDAIEGLSPAISIEQKSISHNPRSTVGTVTEIYDYLRLLFARIGEVFCYKCGRKVEKATVDDIVSSVLKKGEGTRLYILAPIARSRKGEYKSQIETLVKQGYFRFFIDNVYYDFSKNEEIPKLDKYKKHNIDVVVDRVVVKQDVISRLKDSIELSLSLSNGYVAIADKDFNFYEIFSEYFACTYCDIHYGEIEPDLFSFNLPKGACPHCKGTGTADILNFECVKNKFKNPLEFYLEFQSYLYSISLLEEIIPKSLFKKSFSEFDEADKELFLNGNDQYKGFNWLINYLIEKYRYNYYAFSRYVVESECNVCNGSRLNELALSVKINNYNIYELTQMSILQLYNFIKDLKLEGNKKIIAEKVIKEILSRLEFLVNVGLDYITLSRSTKTLSGGEAQRIRLATQIGSKLTGVMYVLDEPSIGLHPRDNEKLLKTLKDLRDLGNSVIVVEHDEETMLNADWIVDIGPYAGELGGKVVAEGTPIDIMKNENSITGKYLSGKLDIEVESKKRKGNGKFIEIIGARGHNLKNINVKIPLGTFVVVTGVSGSGKSSLINETLYPFLHNKLYKSILPVLPVEDIQGWENIDKIIDIDQSPIGRTPRSNPATYTGVFDDIRKLFASLRESKIRGYTAGRFSFNKKGGRCEKCEGAGVIKIEMNFLPDVYVTCDHCKGKRYNDDVLFIKYKGYSISDVLNLTVNEAIKLFENQPKIVRKLKVLKDVGLGYIRLGQNSITLSGGEAQRIKLATELLKVSTGKTLYILDEPSTGLHKYDVNILLKVLHRLVDLGNTVIVIEHNLDIIKTADYIIDLGPEGGDKGGEILYAGELEGIINNERSYTGEFLKKCLKK